MNLKWEKSNIKRASVYLMPSMLVVASFQLLALDLQRRFQSESDCGLCGQHNFLVSSKSCACGTCPCSSGGADSGAFASAGESADESAQACASASHYSSALAFAF